MPCRRSRSRKLSLPSAASGPISSLRLHPSSSHSTKRPRRSARRASNSSSARWFQESSSYTTDILFRDLWLRPDLAPRDRSLVTVSALIASGQVAQIPYHLNRAMDNGLTQAQGAEVITHLAFYAGWPSAFSALPVAKDVFEKRPR
jgi:alkylhydroperoxidase/carboxymuconolactone decarboxylase family protein YurZ